MTTKILHLIIPSIYYIWLVVCKPIEGIDIDCTVDCACCNNGTCGPGKYFDDECKYGCIDGYAGARCYNKCPENCKRCTSVEKQYDCNVCHDGFYHGPARICTSECLPMCKTCTSGTSCTSCKDEYYNANGSNDCRYRYCPENCKCEKDQCVSCTAGYYDIRNSCNSLCPSHCVTCLLNTYCDSCKDGHYNGYQYDDSSLPLMNDCTNECRGNCEQCSSYDVCSKCQSGFYGPVCDKSCSPGCTTGICNIQSGNCECSPYFDGDKCDRCIPGKYGDMCDKQCSMGCKGNVCEKETGDCIDGCIKDTIVGDKCDICTTSWYGPYCNLSCSVGCNHNQCKRSSGECTDGCLHNLEGRQCDQCILGKNGEFCNIDCPSNCKGKKCLKESGNCIQCLEIFDGVKCERCVAGLYGATCSENCPPYCLDSICDRDSGKCSYGCVNNYSGDKCCLNNKNCITCSSDVKCKRCKPGYFNDLCDKRCPTGCVNACDIGTGVCDDCKNNFYGEKCTISCSLTCKNESNDSDQSCERDNGYCKYGCSDGFFGPKCTEKCSSRCVGNKCDEKNGKCTMGCQSMVEDPFCTIKSASSRPSDQSNTVVIIAFGTILALSLVANVLFVVIFVVPKLRRRIAKSKQTNESFYANDDRITASNNDDKAMTRGDNYENLEMKQGSNDDYEGIQQHP